ncbi:MAG: hypothetical protein IKE05_04875, partial [Clostridia bacterium]|nr:hypothetical protein [Clostridia bacterium]
HYLYTFNEQRDSSGNSIFYAHLVDGTHTNSVMLRTSLSAITVNTDSNWNANNPSFCYYTQGNTDYYENANHILVNETNGNTPTAYHLSGNAVTYSNSAMRGKLNIDTTGISAPGDACIGGEAGHLNGNIIIHGGNINLATSSDAACIGSGDCYANSTYQINPSQITIYGGNINAMNHSSSSTAAVIGGGSNSGGGTIRISGGRITTTSKTIGIGGGALKQGLASPSQPTGVTLNWTNKNDYIDCQCGGFRSNNNSNYTNVIAYDNRFIYQRRGTAQSSTDGSGIIVSVGGTGDNLTSNKNFKIIPYFEVDYPLLYPQSGVVLPFGAGSAYAFGCDTNLGTKCVGIYTKDNPETSNIDETCTVVKPYCLALTMKAKVMKRVKNYTTVNGVRQAVYYTSDEAGYDSIDFDIVEIIATDANSKVTETGASLNNVQMLFVGDDYNYNSGKESIIDGVKDSTALKFGVSSGKKPGIYQGSVNFIAGTGIIEDENVNSWYDYYA